MSLRIDHTVTNGEFNLDGETHCVDNNVWVIGDDERCVVIDAPHDADAICELVGDRTLEAIWCTHGHDDHVRVAPELRERTGAPIYLHPDCKPLWEMTHPHTEWDHDLVGGSELRIAGELVQVLHTPGHAPGAVCFYLPSEGIVFTGDTLFQGGPGATGRSYSDYDTIVHSIRTHLFALPDHTDVRTGHGSSTTIGAEKANLG